MSLRRFLERNGRLLGLAASVVALSAVGAGLFTHAYLGVLHEGFRDRSLAYVQAFAAASLPSVSREDVEILRSTGRLLLAGSARFVQISDGRTILVDERTAAAEGLELPLREDLDAPSLTLRTEHGSYLDILVPLSLESTGGTPAGYARIGIDRTVVLSEATGAVMIGGGAALGFDAVLIVLLALALRRPRRDAQAPPKGEQLVRSGPLEIDVERRAVRLDGTPVRLTPKQFALLELLARAPGRVFAEREILDAAWPDSPYADAKDIKQYVYLLRRTLSTVDPEARNLIETVPGFGYRWVEGDVDRELT